MVALPCFVVVLLLGACLGQTDEADNEPLKCPGVCKHENDCGRSINETDCSEGLVCCVDLFEQITTSEFPDWSFTTQGSVDPDTPEEVKEEILETGQPAEEYEYAATNGDEGYTYVYSESDAVTVDPEEPVEMTSQEAAGGCPGQCVAPEYATACNYIINTINDDICPAGGICCFVSQKEDVDEVSYENDPKSFQRRISVEEASGDICPGTCVHPSHAMFCDRILPEYPCPLNAKCCVKRAVERSVPQSPATQCVGRCLPASMHGYCFPPNELMLGETTCPRGTTCCMKKPADNLMQPPSVNRMQFPSIPSSSPMDAAQVVLGHLAVDEEGTVYRVNTNGAIHPLPKLTTTDHLRARYNRLTAYPRPNGEIVIFSDAQGILYQQLFPRLPQGFAPQSPPPAARQPINQFADSPQQSIDQLPPTEAQEEPDEEVKGIVLPDDGDAAPVVANTPVVHDSKNSRPNCPGTCMSYFMRFTCYRGYATYDGFFCPGRSVCCARLTDIEEHEEYLKSLSPYFKNPHVAREMTAPTCGIKGRRDTPRIVGGKDALPGEWCWQVSIINVQNQYICGGALIDNSWVLTAAHCVVGPMRENKVIFVRSGVTDLKSREENRDAQTIRVMSTFVHHNFNNMNLDNNIALLRLQKPVFFNSNTCVICLPTSGRVPDAGTKCTVTGYGFVSPDGEMALRVREAKVPIVDDTECMINVTEALTNPFILPASSLCAGGHGQQDACQGDAGGPLACEIGGFHELTGLVSWSLGCGRTDVPSIYVKVPAFMGWINQIISTSSFITSL